MVHAGNVCVCVCMYIRGVVHTCVLVDHSLANYYHVCFLLTLLILSR